MRNRIFTKRIVILFSLALIGGLSPVQAEKGKGVLRNAVFNGDFIEGLTGWGALGPGYQAARLAVDKTQHVDILITDLIVRSPETGRTFTVYSQYPLKVKQGREYRMVVTASGKGHFQIGAFEYSDKGEHIGNRFSERYALTNDFKEYSFAYKPSQNATGIRPAIAFLNTDGTKLDVDARIRRVEIPVHSTEFQEMCKSWPEYAKDTKFDDFKGFTEKDLKELQAVAEVNTVLPPYKPIVMNSPGNFTFTTSQMDFGRAVFPKSISVLGREVLAGPMELSVTLGDGKQMKLQPQPPAIHSTDQKAVLRQEFHAAGKNVLTVNLEMDYDALLIYTLDFPKNPGLSVSNVTLSIPFPADVAKYIQYQHFPFYGGGLFGYGPIPQKGEKIETKAVLGSVYTRGAVANDWKPDAPGQDGFIWEWKHPEFPNVVWVGDEKRGVSFLCLSTKGYRTRKGDPVVRLVRHDKEVRLTFRFITDKASLDQERTLQFVLQIMPPKPVRKEWISSRFNAFFSGYLSQYENCIPILEKQFAGDSSGDKDPGELPMYTTDGAVGRTGIPPRIWKPKAYRKYRDIGFLWFTLWSEGSTGWVPGEPGAGNGCGTPLVGYPKRFSQLVKYSDLLGHLGLPYLAPTHIGATDPAGYYYVEKVGEWVRLPQPTRPPTERPVCANSLFSAYIARCVGKLIDEYGISGVYFDNASPRPCMNTKHGCGYVDENGELQGTLPLLGFRNLYKMVRNEFVKRGKEPLILTHAGMWPGAVSFLDVDLNGEGTYGSDHTEILTLGEWRAQWIGPNQFGIQKTYLPSFGHGMGPGVDKVHERLVGTPRLLAMSLLHGTQVWSNYTDRPLVYKVWTVLDELDEPDVAFIPYWEWESVNRPLNPRKVYATAYSGKERLLLVLSNLSDKEQDVAVPLSEIQAKNPAVNRVADHMHALPVHIKDGMVRCRIGPKNFRLLSFSKE